MLSNYRLRAGLNKSALARAVGVSIGYISKLEIGKKPPPENQRQAICEVLGLSEEESESFHIKAEMERSDPTAVKYLMKLIDQVSDSEPARRETAESDLPFNSALFPGDLHSIPIINKAAAGYPQEFTDLDYPAGVADGYIAVPDISDPNAFGFYVSGNSMEPDFPDGTLLIASPNTIAFEGDPCFVRFSQLSRISGCSFKRIYFMQDGRVRLVPINRHYAEEIFERQELTGIWPAVRSYGKINRGGDNQIRRKTESGGTPEAQGKANRPASAAG